jgi:uncharacterized phage protein (TIGR02218 family)
MTYQAIEASAFAGEPIELYRFVLGGRKWLYTSGQHEVTHNVSEVYQPVTITRSAIEQGLELARSSLDVRVARDNDLAGEFVAAPPEGVLALTLYRRHAADPEVVTIWKGRVVSARWSGSEISMHCEPVSTSLLRPGLRARYSIGCRHPLYSPGCGLDQEAWRTDGTIGAISGLDLTIAAAGTQPDGWFVAGKLVTAAGRRLVTGHVGTTITLVAPIVGLAVGEAAHLYAGCDHSTGACDSKFSNLDNYGGFPWIPRKNPFAGDGIV